ncbi:hypothetical protein ABPG74_016542 [Tetrahymena malaccensis]
MTNSSCDEESGDCYQPLIADIECTNKLQKIENIFVLVIQCLFLIYQTRALYKIRLIFQEQGSKYYKQIYYIHFTCLAISLILIAIQVSILTVFCDQNLYDPASYTLYKSTLQKINLLNMGYMIITFFYFVLYLLVTLRWLTVIEQIQEYKLFVRINKIIQISIVISYCLVFFVCIGLLIHENTHINIQENFYYQTIMHYSILICSLIQITSFFIISYKFYQIVKNIYDIEYQFKQKILYYLIPLCLIGLFKCVTNLYLIVDPRYSLDENSQFLNQDRVEIGIIFNLNKIFGYCLAQFLILQLFYPKRVKTNNVLTFQEDEQDVQDGQEVQDTQEINKSQSFQKSLICNNSKIQEV